MSERSNVRDQQSEIAASGCKQSTSTLAALITPPGRGALATVRVRGPEALNTVAVICRSSSEVVFRKYNSSRPWITRWEGPDGEPVVIHVHACDLVDVHCHGGLMPVQAVLRSLETRGVRQVPWSDFSRRAARVRIVAAAAEALAQAPTLRTAAILLDQFHGTLSDRLAQLLESLEKGKGNEVCDGLARLLGHAELGRHLIEPWRIAIVGRPNVGKSSLLNALVGFDRAIVHAAAGTTRDLVTATTAIDGWPVELCDSAGIHTSHDAIESAGIERARQEINQSDLQLVVLDRSQPLTDEDHAIIDLCPRPTLVASKCDLPAAWNSLAEGRQLLPVSSVTRAGLDELFTHLSRTLVPNPPTGSEAVPFTDKLIADLQRADHFIRTGEPDRAVEVFRELLGCGASKV